MVNNLFNAASLAQLDKFGLSANTQRVALACALLWTFRAQSDVLRLLDTMMLPNENGRKFTLDGVNAAIQEIHDKELLVEHPRRSAFFHLADSLRAPLYRQLLETLSGNKLVELIEKFDEGCPSGRMG